MKTSQGGGDACGIDGRDDSESEGCCVEIDWRKAKGSLENHWNGRLDRSAERDEFDRR